MSERFITAPPAPEADGRVLVDTHHFKGNFPDRFLLRAARLDAAPPAAEIEAASAAWPLLVGETRLSADAVHEFGVASAGPATHIRLDIFPDGGVSRLRLYGTKAE